MKIAIGETRHEDSYPEKGVRYRGLGIDWLSRLMTSGLWMWDLGFSGY